MSKIAASFHEEAREPLYTLKTRTANEIQRFLKLNLSLRVVDLVHFSKTEK